MKDVAFVIRLRGMGSSQVRGVQMAQALGATLLSQRELATAPPAGLRTVVFVKEVAPVSVMTRLRDTGVAQLLDPLDNYDWRAIRTVAPYLSGFIGANHTHTVELTRRFGVPATRIPHHHCNFGEVAIPAGREPPSLGYIGGRDHWPESRRLIQRLPYPRLAYTGEGGGTLLDAYLGTDIGFAYRTSRDKLSYNSAVKLVNFMSFGIPSVLSTETGYLEVSRHYEACLYAHSKAEFRVLLDEVASSPGLRRSLGEAGRELARAYHIRVVAGLYRTLLESLPRP